MPYHFGVVTPAEPFGVAATGPNPTLDHDQNVRRHTLPARWWIQLPLLLGLVASLPSLCVAAHHRVLEAEHTAVEHAGVSVEVHVLDADQTEDIFDADLLARGIQPLVITIRNHSTQTYRFTKADVDAHYIPATIAAKAAYENPVVISGRVIGRAVSVIPRWIFPHHNTPPRPLLNRDIQANFVREEIRDADVGPNSSLSGFLFSHPPESTAHLHIRLLSTQTQVSLEFDVPAQSTPLDHTR